MSDVYDSDDAVNRSPGLTPSVIKYGPDVSVPPFLQEKHQQQLHSSTNAKRESPSSPTALEDRSPKHRRPRKYLSTLGDAVLIGFLDPNRPDIARQAGEETLIPESDESEDDNRTRVALTSPKTNLNPNVATASVFAKTALDMIPDDYARTNANNNDTYLPSIKELVPEEAIYKPPPPQREPFQRPREDSLAASNLGKFTISPPNNHEIILPALHGSTPSAAGSPDNTQSLPSIRSAVLAELENNPSTPFNMPTPTPQLARGASTQSEISVSRISTASTSDASFPSVQIPTPYSHPSPMSLTTTSPASQSQYTMPPPTLTPDTSNMTSYSESSWRQASIGKSPANNYPTPTETRSIIDERPDTLGTGQNLFKCKFPGCTAAAFQTQYLLNSHANVHSQDRPHFCHVIGCPRGVGGKGFKRKNEMIRHGLVHDSPGYVCPFCTDQQHKYPRPDNLQRHVRVHHIDKNKDDPELRNVLAQRPKGSGRGRRRRIHS